MTIAVVTDSSATLPQDVAEELQIGVIPMSITISGRALRDGVEITPAELYRRLRVDKHIPTTSSPSVGEFVQVYAAISRRATGILSIHVPSWLSATYQTAVTASRLLANEIPIQVFECTTAAMGQGFVTLEAARAAAAGADMEAAAARAREVDAKARLFVMVETLEYLHRGGRIGRAAMLMASMLQIKPVLFLGRGQVDVLARPRTRGRALQIILQQIAQTAGNRPLHVAIQHADALEQAEGLKQAVLDRFHCVELYVTQFTPVMGAHTGPGLLGAAFYVE